ncbi:hypothetical protein N1851_009678 [Merluccius polli]|uniref:ribonuclease H n=1 Tax=Merluccius polli TaxID=89951 RepID=A0AA47MZH9_MERPO|nr:hypothetical protein N1851_009678 [Merluccius polli]
MEHSPSLAVNKGNAHHPEAKQQHYRGEANMTAQIILEVSQGSSCTVRHSPQGGGGASAFGKTNVFPPKLTGVTGLQQLCKKNCAVRIFCDFKVTVNPVLHAHQYPLLLLEDIFASMARGERFSKIDFDQAYLHMEMGEAPRKYLTMNTTKGLYQYNRLVFGISSGPAIWQRAMDQVLQGIPGTQCRVDDDTHQANLQAMLSRLEEYGLRANKSKCQLFNDSIEFCVCCNWASNGSGQKTVNETAKQLITSEEVLRLFDPSLPLCLACATSLYGIGAILSHKMT